MYTFGSSARWHIALAITILHWTTTISAQQLNIGPPLDLSTTDQIPATWTVPKACFTPVSTNDGGDPIYNQGCGISSRKSCCPPGFATDVIFDKPTTARSDLSPEGCPSGYIGDPQWWGFTGMPRLDQGASTVICCPGNINTWKLFKDGKPLCFTQNQYSTSGSVLLDDPYFVSTYARPFFIVAAEASTTSESSQSSTQSVGNSGASRPSSSEGSESTSSSSSSSSRGSSSSLGTSISSDASNTRDNVSNTQTNPAETNSPEDENSENRSGMTAGPIAGIVVAVVLTLFIAIGVFIFFRRRRILSNTAGSRNLSSRDDPPEAPVPPPAYELDSRNLMVTSSAGTSETEEIIKRAELAGMGMDLDGRMRDERVHFPGRPYGYTENYAIEPTFQNEAKTEPNNKVRREVEAKRISGRGM